MYVCRGVDRYFLEQIFEVGEFKYIDVARSEGVIFSDFRIS
jgi:hypothetical protein